LRKIMVTLGDGVFNDLEQVGEGDILPFRSSFEQ
jgi:hypothetical protein